MTAKPKTLKKTAIPTPKPDSSEARVDLPEQVSRELHGLSARDARKLVRDVLERFDDRSPKAAFMATIDALQAEGRLSEEQADELRSATLKGFKCYAAQLSERFGGKAHWPDHFDKPKKFPGRMAKSAASGSLRGKDRTGKPWLDGLPRLVFVSDMGDALSNGIEFEFLLKEIIEVVTSAAGKQHVWLWLTKRPRRMAEFGEWLKGRGIDWPDNLVAMTTVTSQKGPQHGSHHRGQLFQEAGSAQLLVASVFGHAPHGDRGPQPVGAGQR